MTRGTRLSSSQQGEAEQRLQLKTSSAHLSGDPTQAACILALGIPNENSNTRIIFERREGHAKRRNPVDMQNSGDGGSYGSSRIGDWSPDPVVTGTIALNTGGGVLQHGNVVSVLAEGWKEHGPPILTRPWILSMR